MTAPGQSSQDGMGDWMQIRNAPTETIPAASAPGQASPDGAGEPERMKLLAVGVTMILAALAGVVIYGIGLPELPKLPTPAAPPGLALTTQRQVSVQSPPVQPRTGPTAAADPTQASPRRPQAELRGGPGQPPDTAPDASVASRTPPAAMPGGWRASATFNALPDCDEPIMQYELMWLAGAIPELLKAGERTTAMERATANGNSRDGRRACRADLRTTDNLYQVDLSLKVVGGFVEVTFLSLRKYVRGQPADVPVLRPNYVVLTTLAVVRR